MLLVALTVIVGVLGVAASAFGQASPLAHAAYAQTCPQPYPATRDAANPLMLANAPGTNPLNGAQFFVAGPNKGPAAQAIARLMGLNPDNYSVSYSWAHFVDDLNHGALAAKLAANHQLAWKVHMLEKIASNMETNRFSIYSGGGGPGAIFSQVQRIFCKNLTADPAPSR